MIQEKTKEGNKQEIEINECNSKKKETTGFPYFEVFKGICFH